MVKEPQFVRQDKKKQEIKIKIIKMRKKMISNKKLKIKMKSKKLY
jgi:hypothetical protein